MFMIELDKKMGKIGKNFIVEATNNLHYTNKKQQEKDENAEVGQW